MEITTLDENGLQLIRIFEGCILYPYLDITGTPTIGYGLTYYPSTGKKVTMKDHPITQQQADEIFLQMVKPFELAIYSTTRDDLKQNQFNSLVSLAYNIGVNGFKSSTVHKLVNQNIAGAQLKKAWLAWNKSDHKIIDALVKRRLKEFENYIS